MKEFKIFLITITVALVIIVIFVLKFCSESKNNSNIILITIDALRADHLGCYGYKRNTSPIIDDIAKEGTIFLNSISAGPGSLPAMISLITSKYGPEHKVESWDDKLGMNITTLPQVLKSYGFTTAFICAHYTIPKTMKNRKDKDWIFLKNYSSEANINNFFIVNNGNRIAEDVNSWLDKNRFNPFFLWIHFMDVHAPYRPPQPYSQIYINDAYYKGDVKVKFAEKGKWNAFGGIPKYMRLDNNNILDYYISQYDGEIRFVDGNIGKIITYLKKLKLNKNTALFITSEHGECLGEHNYFGHDCLLYDTLIKVPLIIVVPWIQNQKERVVDLVETIDIAPTILDLLKVEMSSDFQGESLLPLVLNIKSGRNKTYAFSSTGHGVKKFSIRIDSWKLIFDKESEIYELYNLNKDPTESDNLIEREKERFEILKEKLDNYIKQLKSPIKKTKAALDEETKKILKSLGYLQ